MNRSLLLLSALLACAAGAHAELYKWVGPDGKISYSDTPPPATARLVETRQLPNAADSGPDLPYELAQAVRNGPVTLYTTADCLPCDEGRKLLAARGVPYTEKTVNDRNDTVAFRKAAGNEAKFPYLLVGRDGQQGFQADAWNRSLSAAGYPETSQLPKSYRNPPPQPAAPARTAASAPSDQAPAPAKSRREADASNSGQLPPPIGNAPPGFRF